MGETSNSFSRKIKEEILNKIKMIDNCEVYLNQI